MKRGGFSLVELSVVLVVLGLLVGGIVGGKSLIRASELRSVASEHQRYRLAIEAFRNEMGMLPGDTVSASKYWGRNTARCNGAPGAAGTPGTCNGDGNGHIDLFVENYLAWQHLGLAGAIEGQYSGYVTPAANSTAPQPERDVPQARLTSAFWQLGYLSQNSTVNFELGYSDHPDIRRNYLLLTGLNSTWWVGGAIAKPAEFWSIDNKMDDARPATGMVRANPNSPNCATSLSITAEYATQSTGKTCLVLGFIL